MKLKNKLIYIIATIISIYMTYLVSRFYDLRTRGIICIAAVILGIALYLTYLWRKNVQEIKPKKRIIIISVIISIIVMIFNWNILTKKYQNTSVEVSWAKILENNNYAVKNIVVDGAFYIIKDNQVYNDVELANDINVKVEKISENTLKLEFDKNRDIKLVLDKNAEKVEIIDGENGENKENIKFDEEDYTYKIQSNVRKDALYVIRIICSFAMVLYIITMLVCFFDNVKDKDKKTFLATMLISICGGYFYFTNSQTGMMFPDSISYMKYDFSMLFNLVLPGRVPIYPIILRILEKIFFNKCIQFTCIMQYLFWFVSVIYFYKTVNLITKNRKFMMIMTILYAFCPGIILWNNCILTESIALSATIIFIYYIIKYIKNASFKDGAISIIIAFILTFIRPTAIIYVLFLEIFWVARFILDRKSIKIDIKCFILSTATILLVVIYAIIFHNSYGIYSISDAVVRQDLVVSIQEGYYKSSQDEQFIKYIDEEMARNSGDTWETNMFIQRKYKLPQIKSITNYCRMVNIQDYIEYIKELIQDHSEVYFNSYSQITTNEKWLGNAIKVVFEFITFAHIYIILIIELVLLVVMWIKEKKVPWLHAGLFAFPFVIVFSSFIGTCAEYMRTALCALPFAYVSIATYFDLITTHKLEKEEKNY